MNRRAALGAVLAAGFALAGCAVAPLRTPLPPLSPSRQAAAVAAQEAREATLASMPDWHLDGRVALTHGSRGGSGRLEWTQRGPGFEVVLSAPVTRQGWRLAGTAGDAVLEGLDGGPRHGPDAAALLREATGWEIPVEALSRWVRGARAAGSEARLEFSADGRLSRLEQDGWTLDYADWRAQAGGIELPMRVTASRDPARVRLVVNAWSPAEAGP
jgi:outer membrane lipoprotein LolB